MAELDRACCDYPDAVTGIVTAEKLAELANKNQHESTLRNAILVESIQGLPDIKMMQAESRFLQQWNSYVAITAESGVQTRKVTHGLVSWGMSIQNLLYATVVAVGAPLVINGDITTGCHGGGIDAVQSNGCSDDGALRGTGSLAAGESSESKPG